MTMVRCECPFPEPTSGGEHPASKYAEGGVAGSMDCVMDAKCMVRGREGPGWLLVARASKGAGIVILVVALSGWAVD
jgi:hypothetical protein